MWRGVVLLLFLLGLPSSASAGGGQASGEAAPAEVEEVAPGVFVRRGVHALMAGANAGGIANTGFIVGSEAVAVIDTGGSRLDGARLLAAVRAHTALPIRYVINTHVHPDHIFGNAAFLAEDPVFVGHAHLPRALQARGAHYLEANRRLLGAAAEGTEVIPPGLLVEERARLDLGGRVLELTAHPTAHTDNDLTVFDLATGTLWTGDLLFVEHLPVIDGSLKGWLAVMDGLAALPAARAVPGHGPAAVPWPQALAAQRGYLNALAADLRALIAAGETMRHAAERAGQSARGDWLLFDEFNPRNATVGFAELEWE